MPVLSLAIVLLLGVSAIPATVLAQDATGVQAAFIGAERNVADYQVGPGDVLSMRVSGIREFEISATVSNSGRMRVPFVGVIPVAGRTTVDLEREVAKLIAEREIINEPAVRIQVERHRAQPTYVVGEVNAPGQFVITGDMYLLELLSKAGGLAMGAEDFAFLYRRHWPAAVVSARLIPNRAADDAAPAASAIPASATPPAAAPDPSASAREEVLRIDLVALRSGTRPDLNVRLKGGDILYVPRQRPRDIYIVGDIRNPGAYALPRRGEVTAVQAITYAGGPTRTAKLGSGFLMRHENGTRVAIPVDFAAIIHGREPDIPVKANDIIYIPSSTWKTIGVGMLDMIPGLIIQYLIF